MVTNLTSFFDEIFISFLKLCVPIKGFTKIKRSTL